MKFVTALGAAAILFALSFATGPANAASFAQGATNYTSTGIVQNVGHRHHRYGHSRHYSRHFHRGHRRYRSHRRYRGCGWLLRKAKYTGSQYWYNRYYKCRYGHRYH